MVYHVSPRDIAILVGGIVQGRFSSMGGAGGIDLHIAIDGEGVHGIYEGHDFSLTLSEQMNTLGFSFKMKVPLHPEETHRDYYSSLSRIIGDTTVEIQGDTYSARGIIRKYTQQIKSPNDIFNDLWNYIMKDPFSKVLREITANRHSKL